MHRYFGDLSSDNTNSDVFNDVQRVQASTATWILLGVKGNFVDTIHWDKSVVWALLLLDLESLGDFQAKTYIHIKAKGIPVLYR